VYPVEVEAVLLAMDNVEDAVVHGEPNAISGQAVVAHLKLGREEPLQELKIRLRRFCLDRLAPYKVPARVIVSSEPLHTARFKRSRRNGRIEAAGAA
jgi:long-chain acyl-CoA synthetase